MTYESLEQAKLFHEANEKNWAGEALAEYKHEINKIINEKNIKSILDYGCGKAIFQKYLFKNLNVTNYDPAVKKFSNRPQGKFNLVICIDVMEHVEESKIEEVLEDVFNFGEYIFLTITCYPALQVLPNGKNAHYTVKEPIWWEEKLKKYLGKYTVIFQTKKERSKITVNEEEWVPHPVTLERLKKNINDPRVDPLQKEKYLKFLNQNPRS